ncbi:MAG: hypothetical protein Q8J65_03325 [Nitrosomonadales bacterium]|nr:hypothetical protein [Nitrosomonadales bacterium]
MKPLFLSIRLFCLLLLTLLVTACAHSINVSPLSSPPRNEATLVNKHVAYVMTDELRNKIVTTSGGGGDKVSYSPYRDLEKVIRDSLRAVYQEVTVINSISEAKANPDGNIALVFTPEISTTSSSDSMLTWPPTQFFINLECTTTDLEGKPVAKFRLSGNGAAEFSEFKSDFGLAGRRAATDLGSKIVQEIFSNPSLQ